LFQRYTVYTEKGKERKKKERKGKKKERKGKERKKKETKRRKGQVSRTILRSIWYCRSIDTVVLVLPLSQSGPKAICVFP
jgi:hypothetical protein